MYCKKCGTRFMCIAGNLCFICAGPNRHKHSIWWNNGAFKSCNPKMVISYTEDAQREKDDLFEPPTEQWGVIDREEM